MTTTIIFGNGIGMAVDSSHFSTQHGLDSAWNEFNATDQSILSIGRNQQPICEDDLEKHHSIMTTCRYLNSAQGKWLAEDGKKFADLYQNYIFKVAAHFFKYNENLPDIFSTFIDNLSSFINNQFSESSRCHIVTLNYDKLLYEALIKQKYLDHYHDGGLVDGIYNNTQGFSPENLIRTYYNFGWYLHLHGSPVFRTRPDGTIDKCNLNELPDHYASENATHNCIVLGNARIKKGIINDNTLLNTYFNFFINALNESNKLIIIGYSGLDDHVNLEINKWVSTSPNNSIDIIEWQNPNEWNNSDAAVKRTLFWKEKLCSKSSYKPVEIFWRENILQYDFIPSSEN